jgi:hypothetical protein
VDTDAERRRLFFGFIDEAQTCDGASNGTLAALLEQCAKFGLFLFLFLFNQTGAADRADVERDQDQPFALAHQVLVGSPSSMCSRR